MAGRSFGSFRNLHSNTEKILYREKINTFNIDEAHPKAKVTELTTRR